MVNVFLIFCLYLPLEKSMAPHLSKLKSLNSRLLCAKFGWNCLSGSREDFLKLSSYISSPLHEWCGPSFEKNLNLLHSKMLCNKFGWKSPGWSWKCAEFTDRQQVIRKVHFSFQPMCVKRNTCNQFDQIFS